MSRRRRPETPRISERIADNTPAIYGSLLVTTLVAVQWKADAVPELIGISLVIGVAVFWLAHAWAEIINRRVHGPISVADVGRSR